MAKAKYKIDTFIKFAKGGTEHSGDIQGVITRKDGYHYEVEEDVIAETDVLTAYRPVKARQMKTAPKAKANKSASKKKTETATSEASVQ